MLGQPVARLPPVERADIGIDADGKGRAGVLTGELAELPLSGEQPQRVVHGRGQPERGITGDRLWLQPGP